MNAIRFLLFGALLGLAGCLPVSKNPLSAPEDATADARLAGVWYGKSGEDTVYLHFVAGKAAAMDAVEVDHGGNGDAHATIYTVFPTVIEGGHYLNIRDKKATDKLYYLARYHMGKSGEMSIWLMSEKAAARAIKAEKLTGKIKTKNLPSGSLDRDITLTSSTEELAAYVRKGDPELIFSEKFGTFKKLALPALPDSESTPAPSPKHTRRKKKA